MDLIIIRYGIWFLIVISIVYFHWYFIINGDLPKEYDEFMEFVIKEKIFDNSSFYSQAEIENDYKKRKIPIFDEVDFVDYDSFLKSKFKNFDEMEKFNIKYKSLRRNYFFKNFRSIKKGYGNITRIPDYFNIPKKIIIAIAIILGLLILSDVFIVKPLVDKQYLAAGISDPEKRYIVSNETVETEAEILEKTYNSSFFGSEKYEFKIKVNELEEELVIEVDPFIYQKKKVEDKLLVNVVYKIDIDNFKNTKKVLSTDIIIAE